MANTKSDQDDSLLKEIDFLIVAAEQAGDNRESIRLISATLRNISSGLRGMGYEISSLRADLVRQTDMLTALSEKLQSLEGKVGEGAASATAFADAMGKLSNEWRSTKLVILGMFLVGGVATVCLVIFAVMAQVYLVSTP